jgi:hypothetical protein
MDSDGQASMRMQQRRSIILETDLFDTSSYARVLYRSV